MKRVQKLRDGRGWYPCYPSIGQGDVYVTDPLGRAIVAFKTQSLDKSLIMACDYCEWANKRKAGKK